MKDRHRDPLPALICLDPIPILESSLLELNVVEKDKDIGMEDLVKKTEVGQILGLMNRHRSLNHGNLFGISPPISPAGIVLARDPPSESYMFFADRTIGIVQRRILKSNLRLQ